MQKAFALYFALLLTVLPIAAQKYPFSDQVVHKVYQTGSDIRETDCLPYRRSSFQDVSTPPANLNRKHYPKVQFDEMLRKMRELNSMLLTTPLLACVQGVGARYRVSANVGREYGYHQDFVNNTHEYLCGRASIELNPFIMANGKITYYNEHWRSISLNVNNLSDMIVAIPLLGGYDYMEYVPPPFTWMGRPVYYDQGFIWGDQMKAFITNKDVPLYIDVTYREFIEANIEWLKQYEGVATRMSTEDAAYYDKMAKEIEKTYRELLKSEQKKNMAESIRTESLKALETAKSQNLKNAKITTETESAFLELLAQYHNALNTYPASKLDAPCRFVYTDGGGMATIFPQNIDKDWKRMVRPNPALVDTNRPADVQLLTVFFPKHYEKYDEEIGDFRHYWMFYEILKDVAVWQKIFGMVK